MTKRTLTTAALDAALDERGGLDARGRLALARVLQARMRLARRSKRARAQFWINDDACAELDLPTWDEKNFAKTFDAVEAIVRDLERRALPRTGLPWRIADLLGDAIELSLVERDVLALALLMDSEAVVSEAFEENLRTLPRLARIAAPAAGVGPAAFMHALEPRSTLTRCHFIALNQLHYDGSLTLHDGLSTLLRAPPRDAAEALRAFVEIGTAPRITVADVDHVRADVENAVALVRAASAQRISGVNVLLWGPPGTGKTETARLVALVAGLTLGEVPITPRGARESGPGHGVTRLGSYEICQRLLTASPQRRGMVLFDELEDVQPRSAFSALHGVAETRDKGKFTRILEENAVPTIWTTNHVDHIDAALLRRFDLVVEVKVPTERVRRRIVESHLGGLAVDERVKQRLAADERLAPAIVSRAARVAALIEPADVGATVQRVVDGALRVVAGPKRAGVATSPIAYDVAFANASMDVDALARAVSNTGHRGVRACLYGPPGAGKTAFVRHAAERSGRRLIVKRMSDLLSCWVGATEQAIARMFEEALDEDAVLLLDEADGLLRSREGATQSWEVTQTNELLTQMESFEGAFFCATNLVDALDHAAFRRFDLKVRFDPLTRPQRRALFAHAFGSALDDVTGHRVDRLEGLCAGHFAAVARRLALMEGRDAIGALEEEHRFVRAGARVGFVA